MRPGETVALGERLVAVVGDGALADEECLVARPALGNCYGAAINIAAKVSRCLTDTKTPTEDTLPKVMPEDRVSRIKPPDTWHYCRVSFTHAHEAM